VVTEVPPGDRFDDPQSWEDMAPGSPHVWRTLGYRRTLWEPGRSGIEWDAPPDYGFPAASGHIIQGGLVTAILDAAMGGATWTLLDHDKVFLTADLRVEFLRAARPGLLRAEGWVIRRARRVMFCAAELTDTDGTVLANSRCTQVILPADGRTGRHSPPETAPEGLDD
jgi:uncharacterized protein (TIGR00369 family)